MKTIIVHDKTGNVLMSSTGQYDYPCSLITEEIPEGKELIGVDVKNNSLILADKQVTTEDNKKLQEKLNTKEKELNNKNDEIELKNKELTEKNNELLKTQAELIKYEYDHLTNK